MGSDGYIDQLAQLNAENEDRSQYYWVLRLIEDVLHAWYDALSQVYLQTEVIITEVICSDPTSKEQIICE